MLSHLPAFLLACLLIAASPGPGTVLIIRNSLRDRRAGFLTVLGNESGVFIWGLAAAFGLTALLDASEAAYDVLRLGGAVVLVIFGIQTLRAARRGSGASLAAERPDAEPGSRAHYYRTGLLLNLANPKAGIFAMAFLPQFVPAGAPHLPTMVLLAAIWAVFEVGYYATYVWGVDRMRTLLARPTVRRRLEQVSGVVLIGLAVRLATDG
ncbi:LysE family translocator [Streptomyces sp. 3MP-14]|uniref:LysE family translocator n=1 Tax=Streptomyces mimosae TaxID=2586635 RepID=A0A5N6AJT3_9ACTN|nr:MULTISPECIES: LysE family translocator [Streptomyces]KAB8167828.1 LysE family translocator [Streptomyces mimosae]KAB8177524.1 LysE family translocator [Streptomyces sp. 3MP-14]